MTREYLLQFCRYYKGEDESPYEGIDQNKDMLWFYEKCWTFDVVNGGDKMFVEMINEYSRVGLAMFSNHDNTPISLKALLFNRYAKGSWSMADAVEGFKRFYNKYYNDTISIETSVQK